MKAFVYVGRPARVVFGSGSLKHLGREIEALGARRALVLSTPEQRAAAEDVAGLLGDRAAGVFDRAVMHVPIETARAARESARSLGADCAVAIGGGSTIGLGKAIALDSGLPTLDNNASIYRLRHSFVIGASSLGILRALIRHPSGTIHAISGDDVRRRP